jgi:Protein of unknown function DUF45
MAGYQALRWRFFGVTTRRSRSLLHIWPYSSQLARSNTGNRMKAPAAKDAKYGFGRLIDLAHAEPVAGAKYERSVVMAMAVEEYERMKALDAPAAVRASRQKAKPYPWPSKNPNSTPPSGPAATSCAAAWMPRSTRISCTAGTLSIRLNTDLSKKPPECLEYIVVQEMAHLLVRHHNYRFSNLMDRCLPNWKLLRQTLNATPLTHANWDY